ncbi:hypothetical protein KIL84_001883, partial [Mauremys mutica]
PPPAFPLRIQPRDLLLFVDFSDGACRGPAWWGPLRAPPPPLRAGRTEPSGSIRHPRGGRGRERKIQDGTSHRLSEPRCSPKRARAGRKRGPVPWKNSSCPF